ncbi:hypothetical protein APSETT444_002921 [Aspergillus pseudonomiae]
MADKPGLITKRAVPPDAIAEVSLSTNSQRADTLPQIGRVKRTRRRHTAAEKLRVISYYRETTELDIATSELKPISLKTAAARFNIQPRSVRRWLNKESSLKALPDSRMNVIAPSSNHQQLGNLRLTRRKIVELGIITKSDWIKVHPMHHPVPFIGIESGKKGRLHTLEDAYKYLGIEQEPSHPGHPAEPESPTVLSNVSFEIQETRSYMKDGLNYPYETRSVIEISKTLYALSPRMSDESIDFRTTLTQEDIPPSLRQGNTRFYYQDLKNCVAIVCRELLKASDKLECVIPVRVGFDYDEPYASAPTQWGAILSFHDNVEILLPLALSMRGPNTLRFSAPDQYFLQGWTIDHVAANGQDHTKRQYYELLMNVLSKFHASPVLHITDVDMLFLCDNKSLKWRPRRFSATWTLYDTILHATYRRTAPVTPVVGVYSDLSVLVNQIRLRGSRVSFTSTPLRKQPFEYLHKEDLRLKHTISESNIPFNLIRQVLVLEHTPQSQEDDSAEEPRVDTDRQGSMTAKLKRRNLMKRNSLFLLLRSGERLVDNKPSWNLTNGIEP